MAIFCCAIIDFFAIHRILPSSRKDLHRCFQKLHIFRKETTPFLSEYLTGILAEKMLDQ